MTPATPGVIERLHFGGQHRITVSSAILTPDTTVIVTEQRGSDNYVATRIVLDEDGRAELIELLGGTP
jgi:predicted nuclease with TOPRIM domain